MGKKSKFRLKKKAGGDVPPPEKKLNAQILVEVKEGVVQVPKYAVKEGNVISYALLEEILNKAIWAAKSEPYSEEHSFDFEEGEEGEEEDGEE